METANEVLSGSLSLKKLKSYKITQTLKNDLKGNVYKCLNLQNWLNIHWCVLKQGNYEMCHDESGRTIHDRLAWQNEVLSELRPLSILPDVFDLFRIDGISWLAMEYVNGQSLKNYVLSIYKGVSWADLKQTDQDKVIDCMGQILTIVSLFHNQGYIHRDLNLANFLVDDSGRLRLLDVELSYDTLSEKPSPPFGIGTEGYMSADQRMGLKPSLDEDIYALGAIMIALFTGISPVKFRPADSRFKSNLNFFMNSVSLPVLIEECMSADPPSRPGILRIQETILNFKKETKARSDKNFIGDTIITDQRKNLIQKSLDTLGSSLFTDHEGIWLSPADASPSAEVPVKSRNFSFSDGISGSLFLFSEATKAGFSITSSQETLQANINCLQNELTKDTTATDAGFYSGLSGVSFSISSLVQANLINEEDDLLKVPWRHNGILPETLGLDSGIAGLGLGILKSSLGFINENLRNTLENCVYTLIEKQRWDGSWLISHATTGTQGIKMPSLVHGIAGICYFLLEYGYRFNSKISCEAAFEGFNWLLKKRQRKDNSLLWYANPHTKFTDPWFEYGFSGIAFLFIKAYSYTKSQVYKDAACSALKIHPVHLCGDDFFFSNGLASLGEIYLEAYREFEEEEWHKRADWIADFFFHTSVENENRCYWYDKSIALPSSGLMNGISGIIHFLLHHSSPDKISFPA